MQGSNAQRTIDMLEYGDLDLNQEIQNGIIMVGMTKVGKTTCGHYLTQKSQIKGIEILGEKVYRVQGITTGPKIGERLDKSETQIPNFFYPSALPQGTALIDFPGFGDSNGCFKIVSNSYFHYRTFSKVKNIKFIIVFDYRLFTGVAIPIAETISSFLDGFDSFLEYKDKIFKSLCILITKVPTTISEDVVKQRFQAINPKGFENVEYKDIYEDLKRQILSKNKLFIFKEAVVGRAAPNNNMITKINQCTSFWQREKKDNKISMDGIRISASALIKNYLESRVFLNQWKQLVQAFQKKSIQFKTEISSFFSQFVKQMFNPDETEACLRKIQQHVRNKIQQRQRNDRLYKSYEDKREKFRKQKFKVGSGENSSTNKTPKWLKKLRIGQLLSLKQKSFSSQNQVMDFSILQQFSADYLQIFQKFAEIYPRNPEVVKYMYKFNRILENNKVMFLILYSKIPLKQCHFMVSDYPHNIKEIIVSVYENPFFQQRLAYCKKLKTSGFQDYLVQEQVGAYLEQTVKTVEIGNQFTNNFNVEEHIEVIKRKKYGLQMEKLGKKLNQILPQPNPNKDELAIILGQAILLKQQLQGKIDDSRLKMDRDEGCIILMMKLINDIGDCLLKFQRFQLAKQCYASIANGYKVLQVYQKRSDKLKNSPKKQKLVFLIEYMKTAKKYEQLDLAMRLGQEAFYLSQVLSQFQKLKICANFIKAIASKRKGNNFMQSEEMPFQEDYMTQIFDQCYYRPLSEKVLLKIKQIAKFKNLTPMGSPTKSRK